MKDQSNAHSHHALTFAGLLITLGIIYGDIGTSPLYVMKSIVGEKLVNKDVIYGAVSLVFWTLTIQTTFKYVMLVLRADNNGEGGIFSLYTLVRRRRRWLLYPAMIGGCAVLSEGMITPPISVSAAIEGLSEMESLNHVEIPTVWITIAIISGSHVSFIADCKCSRCRSVSSWKISFLCPCIQSRIICPYIAVQK